MKQFSLEEYLKNPNRKVVTRDGRAVIKILYTDVKCNHPIIALIESHNGTFEHAFSYTNNGEIYSSSIESCADLFFMPEIHEGWINIYNSSNFSTSIRIFPSEEEAKKEGKRWKDYVTTIKIEWET